MVEIFNEDCFKLMDKFIENKRLFDAIIVDPPYNINFSNLDWDKKFNIELAIEMCSKIIKENGNLIIFQGWSNICNTKMYLDKFFNIQNWIIYDRIKGRGSKKNVVSTREDILWYCNGTSPTFNKIYSNIPKKTKGMGTKNGQANRALTNVWYDLSPLVPWSKERNGHPTQKSVQLMERIVTLFTNVGDDVLDFAMGSGSTGEACKNLNRNFVGIEKEYEWFNIAEKRLLPHPVYGVKNTDV